MYLTNTNAVAFKSFVVKRQNLAQQLVRSHLLDVSLLRPTHWLFILNVGIIFISNMHLWARRGFLKVITPVGTIMICTNKQKSCANMAKPFYNGSSCNRIENRWLSVDNSSVELHPIIEITTYTYERRLPMRL